jgi:hypothetical protein
MGGSTVMLPPGLPDPEGQLVATVDLGALPATDLPLPTDGTLLLFASLEAVAYGGQDEGYKDPIGDLVHVAAGTTVERRQLQKPGDWPGEIADHLVSIGDLRLGLSVSLPTKFHISPHIHPDGGPRWAGDVPEPWHELVAWGYRLADLQLGGYGWGHENEDPVRVAALTAPQPTDPEDRILLAQWNARGANIEGAHVYWTIDRDDLASGRLDRVRVTTYWSP